MSPLKVGRASSYETLSSIELNNKHLKIQHAGTQISQLKKQTKHNVTRWLSRQSEADKTDAFKGLDFWELIYISTKRYCVFIPGPLAVK